MTNLAFPMPSRLISLLNPHHYMARSFAGGCVLASLLLAAAPGLRGQTIIQDMYAGVDSVTVLNTGFGEAGYTLYDGINVNAGVTFYKNSFYNGQAVSEEFRVGFQLIDDTGSVVPLEGGVNQVYDDDWEGNSDIGFPISLGSLQTSTSGSFTEVIRPASQLDPNRLYHVRVNVYAWQRTNVLLPYSWRFQGTLDAAPDNYYHFIGTVSGDAALNGLATLNTPAFTDRSVLAGADPSSTAYSFKVEAPVTLRRFDNWNATAAWVQVLLYFDVELWRRDAVNGDEQIPLVTSRISKYHWSYSYLTNGTNKYFHTYNTTHALDLVPDGVQLDSVNELYYAVVTLSHVEVPSTSTEKPANTEETGDDRLMHFNGTLFWDGIETTLEDFNNDPASGATWSASYVSASLKGAAGYITGQGGYTWQSASPDIRLLADGSAYVVSGAAVSVTPPSTPDMGTAGVMRIKRDLLQLDPVNGLTGNLFVYLPTGMGWAPSATLNNFQPTVSFNSQVFTQALQPVTDSYTYSTGSPLFVMEETKPLAFEASSISLTLSTGQVEANPAGNLSYVRADELFYLEAAPVPAEMRIKRSNEQYYRAASTVGTASSIRVDSGASGEALLSVDVDFGPGDFRTHFPYDTRIGFLSGYLNIVEDLVDVEVSSLWGLDVLATRYNQACTGDACAAGAMLQEVRMFSASDRLLFTRDGGLVTDGPIDTSSTPDWLAWGFIDSVGGFHHETSPFSGSSFHMPGHFIRGDQNTTPDPQQGPSVILYSGFLATDPAVVERPATAAYLLGLTDYAGFNYRTGGDSVVQSRSIIGGREVGFDLTGRCKYTIRPAGVTGIHEAVPGTFPPELTLYGYNFTFRQYGLNYRFSDPDVSRTEGSVVLPYPSDFEQDFEQMKFTCLGGLDNAKVPAGGGDQIMSYWLANITLHTIDFESENACDPTTDTFLLAGVSAEAAYVKVPLLGTLGFMPTGELMVPSSSTINEDSRLYLPAVVTFDGPTKSTDPDDPTATSTEVYQLTPVTLAYYNDYSSTSGQGQGDGKINFAGTLDVAFFEDLEVHMQTSARSVPGTQSIPIYLMGGWTENGSDTFFNSVAFDTGNKGFPTGVPGVNEKVYRNDPDNGGDPKPYLIHAYQDWLGVVNFDYALKWSFTTRSFESYEPKKGETLLVLETEHKLDYLSAATAEMSIGVTYDGLPEINVSNFVINEIDKQTGVYQAMLTEVKKPVVDAVEDGIDKMAQLLDDQMKYLYGDFIADQVEQNVIGPLFLQLNNLATQNNGLNYNLANIQTQLTDRIKTGSNSLEQIVLQMASGVGEANAVFTEVDTRLQSIETSLEAVVSGITKQPDLNADPVFYVGLLAKQGEDFALIAPLIERLLAELSPDISDELNALFSGAVEDLNARINDLLEEAKPTLEQIKVILEDLQAVVADIRTAIAPAGEMIVEVETILAKAQSEIQGMTTKVLSSLEDFFGLMGTPQDFLAYSENEIKTRLRQEIEDLFLESDFVAEIQVTVKQFVQDVDEAINTAISEVFASINKVMREIVSDALAGVDETITGLIGDINDVVGAGKLSGYGTFNGDALRRLHIDLQLQLTVPDEMEFNGYLTIDQMDSEGTGSCSAVPNGGAMAEVTIGATDVPVNWISKGMHVSVEAKFNFQSDPGFKPLGFGGSFEMTRGKIEYESFTITDMGAALMFGATENYLAAKVGLEFSSYEAFGGVYFGRTCSLDPLLIVDKDVAEVIGEPNPTFTGIYVYGECHIPVSEAALGIPASCMFKITAGVGAGVFYFLEGNTFGGKIYAAASGEALCIVSIKGEVLLIGVVTNGDLRFRGTGKVSGKVGPCPFCIKFKKSATITYKDGDWDVDI